MNVIDLEMEMNHIGSSKNLYPSWRGNPLRLSCPTVASEELTSKDGCVSPMVGLIMSPERDVIEVSQQRVGNESASDFSHTEFFKHKVEVLFYLDSRNSANAKIGS